jgi:hypothetical protein
MLYETKFLVSLLFTLIIEIPILFVFVKYIFRKKNISAKKIIISGLIASSLTLPYLWFVLSPYIPANNFILMGESLVVLVEALIYFFVLSLDIKEAFIVSLAANVISFFIGFYL